MYVREEGKNNNISNKNTTNIFVSRLCLGKRVKEEESLYIGRLQRQGKVNGLENAVSFLV